jgi:hypothetical protein
MYTYVRVYVPLRMRKQYWWSTRGIIGTHLQRHPQPRHSSLDSSVARDARASARARTRHRRRTADDIVPAVDADDDVYTGRLDAHARVFIRVVGVDPPRARRVRARVCVRATSAGAGDAGGVCDIGGGPAWEGAAAELGGGVGEGGDALGDGVLSVDVDV